MLFIICSHSPLVPFVLTQKRLQRELKLLIKDPPPMCVALPEDNDILVWHFVIMPKDPPYAGGQ